MHADAAFSIGKTHSICQDYALAWSGNGISAAVLSDGCSGSRDTDIGARIIARACAKALRTLRLPSLCGNGLAAETLRFANKWRDGLELPGSSCDATCLAVATDGSFVTAYIFGDGWLFAERRDGVMEMLQFSFEATPDTRKSFPVYLSYRWKDFDRAAIMQEFGISTWDWVVRRWEMGLDDCWKEIAHYGWKAEVDNSWSRLRFAVQDYRLVGVLSDGADSFMRSVQTATSRQVVAVPFQEIAHKLLRFPETSGGFAVARMKRFAKVCEKEGLFHTDDLSMAVVTLGEEE